MTDEKPLPDPDPILYERAVALLTALALGEAALCDIEAAITITADLERNGVQPRADLRPWAELQLRRLGQR